MLQRAYVWIVYDDISNSQGDIQVACNAMTAYKICSEAVKGRTYIDEEGDEHDYEEDLRVEYNKDKNAFDVYGMVGAYRKEIRYLP